MNEDESNICIFRETCSGTKWWWSFLAGLLFFILSLNWTYHVVGTAMGKVLGCKRKNCCRPIREILLLAIIFMLIVRLALC